METPPPTALIDVLKRQKYHLIGNHSAVKRCRWFYETLVHDRPCYKQKFYGIKSHQCIQMTPAAFYCTQKCVFCWRAQTDDLKLAWNEMNLPKWDSPEKIVQESIEAQERILTGYPDNPKTNRRKYLEALRPKHVAISLTGEPTLYKYLNELIREFHVRGFTSFLVTNGTVPTALAHLNEEPTQLYVSVCAPDEGTFVSVCRPQSTKAWQKLNETLRLLPSFKCPTVLRITSVRNVNMKNPREYATLIRKANPTYIETKAYMHVGYSRRRLNYENMPSHDEIRMFSTELAKETGYRIIDESTDSRVVLLSKLQRPLKFGDGKPSFQSMQRVKDLRSFAHNSMN
jgi:tRNA wybutosine-synthesizing protein 1